MPKADSKKGRSRRKICLKLTINQKSDLKNKSMTVNKEMFIVHKKRT